MLQFVCFSLCRSFSTRLYATMFYLFHLHPDTGLVSYFCSVSCSPLSDTLPLFILLIVCMCACVDAVKRKILVLDLDETLIHSHHDGVLRPTVRPGTPPDFILKVCMQSHTHALSLSYHSYACHVHTINICFHTPCASYQHLNSVCVGGNR